MLLLLVYVDDILITGEDSRDIQQVIQDLHHQFALKTLGSVNYFLGFQITRGFSCLHICQSKCALDLLHKTNYQFRTVLSLKIHLYTEVQ